jgi:hypothetical protein
MNISTYKTEIYINVIPYSNKVHTTVNFYISVIYYLWGLRHTYSIRILWTEFLSRTLFVFTFVTSIFRSISFFLTLNVRNYHFLYSSVHGKGLPTFLSLLQYLLHHMQTTDNASSVTFVLKC